MDGVDGLHGPLVQGLFSPCAGKPLLTIMKREPGGPEVSYKTYPLTLEDLRERGMVRETGGDTVVSK